MITNLILTVLLVIVLTVIAFTQKEEHMQIACGVFLLLILIKGTI